MCHEAENQMEVILDGVKNKQFKAALILLAQTQDKNFKNLDEQLEKISNLIVSNKIDTDIKIEELKKETKVNCTSHK